MDYLELTEQHHRLHANRGMGATKVATRMIAAKNARGWNDPQQEAKARKLLAELGGRTMASFSASQRMADELAADLERMGA